MAQTQWEAEGEAGIWAKRDPVTKQQYKQASTTTAGQCGTVRNQPRHDKDSATAIPEGQSKGGFDHTLDQKGKWHHINVCVLITTQKEMTPHKRAKRKYAVSPVWWIWQAVPGKRHPCVRRHTEPLEKLRLCFHPTDPWNSLNILLFKTCCI